MPTKPTNPTSTFLGPLKVPGGSHQQREALDGTDCAPLHRQHDGLHEGSGFLAAGGAKLQDEVSVWGLFPSRASTHHRNS